jgi:hypothetical protein
MSVGTRITSFTGLLSREFFVTDCATCGVVYGFDEDYRARRREDGRAWCCPNGHSQMFRQSDAAKERKRRERAEAESTRLRARLDQETAARTFAERSAAASRGHLTRMRKRMLAGVCPCCNRSFKQVREHMRTQHPDALARIDAAD